MNAVRCLAAALLLSTNAVAAEPIVVKLQSISDEEVLATQDRWCAALVDISATYRSEGQTAAAALAGRIIDAAYGYQLGTVLFKPTLTVNPQTFRTTRAGALSYFVGGNPDFPNDTGFALNDWEKCEHNTTGIFITGNSASTMGKVHFTDSEGNVTSVDKTWTFVKDDVGELRIVVHHSSLEYTTE